MKQTVTIAIPVYNGEKYIRESLDSIAIQKKWVDEILISDNNSSDKTIDIINEFSSIHSEMNIRIHRNEQTVNVDDNFNKCIELCSSDFLIILGSDDRLKPNSVEMHLQVFNQRSDLGLVGGLMETIDENGRSTHVPSKGETVFFEKGDILKFMKLTSFYMQHSTIMYKMECTREIGYYDSKFIAPDERFSVEHLVKFPIAQIREAVAEARVHSDQVTNDEILRFEEKILHFKANLSMADLESTKQRRIELGKVLKDWVANQCISIGNKVWKQYNNPRLAFKYWSFAIKQDPRLLINYRFIKLISYSVLTKLK